jgi:Leucine-rich repeat (LRR) protein
MNNINVWDTNFANSDFAAFAGHSTIGKFSLDSELLTSIADAASMPNLYGLHLWTGQSYDLNVLVGLANFNELAISAEQVVDFNVFTQLNIEHLWLNGDMEPFQVDIILAYSNLQQLSLGWNSYLTNELLAQFINNNRNLSSLGVEQTLISDLSALFVNGNYWEGLAIPLQYINIDNLAVIEGFDLEAQVQELWNFGVQVDGELAYGWLIADALANIQDDTLSQCITDQTQGMTISGQLHYLDCSSANIQNIWGLWVFDNLRTLILNNNPIRDLGGELDSMQRLQELHINDTLVSDINTLWNNPELYYIAVNNLPLNDPEQVNNLPGNIFVEGTVLPLVALSSLNFNDAELAACIVEQSSGLINTIELHWLNCSGRDISDISDLDQLPFLEALIINDMINITDWSVISRLPQLTWFDAPNSNFNNVDVDQLSGHATLRYVVLSNTQVSDLNGFRAIPNLENLSIDSDQSYDLWQLTDLPNFKHIAINRHQVQDMNALLSMPGLNNLHLMGNLSQQDINTIAQVGKLNTLSIGWGNGMGNEEFNYLIWALPNLTNLHYAGTQLSDISQLPDALPNLDSLAIHWTAVSDLLPLMAMPLLTNVDIDNSPIVDVDQIQQLINAGVNVSGTPKSLVLISSLTFTDTQLTQCVTDKSPGLTHTVELTVMNCDSYGINDISDINQLEYLTELELQNNSGLTDVNILSSLYYLTNLNVTNLGLTDGDLDPISGIANLRDLDLSNNDALTDLGTLNNATQLRAVHLWGSNSYDLTPLTGIPMLHMVALDYAQLSNSVDVFAQMPVLDNLYLNGELPYAALEEILTSVDLSSLSQACNSQFDDSYLQLIIANQPNLWYLGVDNNTLLTDLTGIDSLTNLDNISINNTQINDIQLLIDLRNAQDVLFSNDGNQPRLNYVNIDATPLTDVNQKTILEGLGLQVDGIPQ